VSVNSARVSLKSEWVSPEVLMAQVSVAGPRRGIGNSPGSTLTYGGRTLRHPEYASGKAPMAAAGLFG
jgi:hypothetical protein